MQSANHRETYTSQDLALIIPTKDRPGKLGELLDSIVGQSAACGRVIVIDGSESARETASGFKTKLPIDYYQSPIPGQIRQRNLGISKLRSVDRLIGCLDDDLVLEPDAFREIITFWNSVRSETAGVGFNMVNVPCHRYSRIKGLFGLDHPQMGRVLESGMNTGITHVTANINTQWLGGGYTVWRSDILAAYPQEILNTRWAVGEDLRFSYPVGKKYPLYVCHKARVHHHHVYDQAAAADVARYRGRKIVTASVYFVRTNPELSLAACCWMLLGLTIGRFFQGLFRRDQSLLKETRGQAEGLLYAFGHMVGKKDLKHLLEDA